MMISTIKQTNKKKKNIKIWTIAFWILIWQVGSTLLNHEILLASPLSVGRCLVSLCVTISFWKTIFLSFGKILLGLFGGIFCAIIGAAMSYKKEWIKDMLELPVVLMKTTPVASFIVLALIWLPSKNLSILISFMMAFPIIYSSLMEGFLNLDQKMIEMTQVFRMPFFYKMYYVYVAELFPFFRVSATTAIGMCWKAGIAAEIIGIPKNSIGENIYNAKIYLQTPSLFAWTFAAICISILFEKIFLRIMKAFPFST